MSRICTGCGKTQPTKDREQWWHLSNYFKLNGTFCGECYNKVSHDGFGYPRNPAEYTFMLLKLSKTK